MSHSSTIFFVPFLFSSSQSFVKVSPEGVAEPSESVVVSLLFVLPCCHFQEEMVRIRAAQQEIEEQKEEGTFPPRNNRLLD
ncbi:hypothetical protein L484_020076 [Morus notabilis]|uniref:Uncharacterized protein n=1 Tax=Morus notabilis TaxID=981085 RepID=W9RBB6_9ROSA|nr:hypothetical protein L484_020076 [Morus notabilis]